MPAYGELTCLFLHAPPEASLHPLPHQRLHILPSPLLATSATAIACSLADGTARTLSQTSLHDQNEENYEYEDQL